MPFGSYDQEHRIFDEFKRQIISIVVVLAEDHECLEQAGRNLPVLYSEHNLETISLPICNYGVPAQRPLEQAIDKTSDYARISHNTLIQDPRTLFLKDFTIPLLIRPFSLMGLYSSGESSWCCLAHSILGCSKQSSNKAARRTGAEM